MVLTNSKGFLKMLDIAYGKLKDFSGQYFIFDLKDDLTTDKVLKIVKRLDKINLKTCYILTLSENNYKSFNAFECW